MKTSPDLHTYSRAKHEMSDAIYFGAPPEFVAINAYALLRAARGGTTWGALSFVSWLVWKRVNSLRLKMLSLKEAKSE